MTGRIPDLALSAMALVALGAAAGCGASTDCAGPCRAPRVALDSAADGPAGPGDDLLTTPDWPTGGQAGRGLLDRDGDGFSRQQGDCDDDDPTRHPAAVEICDGVDNDCDGAIDDGLWRALVSEVDAGADATVDSVSWSIYDADGSLAFAEIDSNADGVIDSVTAYASVFDPSGRLAQSLVDYGADGTWDQVRYSLFDDRGRIWQVHYDYDVDGTVNRVDTTLYDADGRRARWEWDTDADGDADTYYAYTYDPVTGLLVELRIVRLNSRGEEVSASRYTYEYQPDGRTAYTHVDTDDDGIYDSMSHPEYDPVTGRLVAMYTDAEHDGVWDVLTRYKYDPGGALEVIETDNGLDGDPDSRTVRFEVCAEPR